MRPMTDLLHPWFQDVWFYTVAALDSLLVLSLIFSVLYSLFLCAAFCIPRLTLSRRHTSIAPLLCGASVLFMFTKAGDLAAGTANGALHTILFFMKETPPVDIIPLIWMTGSILSLLLFVREITGLRSLAAHSKTVANNPAFNKACSALGMQKTVILKATAADRSPASWGLFAKHVFIPEDFSSVYTSEEQYYIFLHELMHIRRLDTVKYLSAELLKTLFWFHPFVLLSIRNIRETIEVDCDSETLKRHDVHPLPYAQLIVKAHANVSSSIPGFSHGAIRIRQRLGYITGDPEWIRMRSRNLLLPILLVALALFTALTGRFVHNVPPAPPTLVDAPNGGKVLITTHIHWRGALGVYSQASAISNDDL